jgi:membrane protein DedA with SNARE-associated domain
VFDSILDAIASSNWTYLLVFGLAFGDVLFPLLPSETAVIAAGVLANTGDLNLAIVIVAAACGAILGDNTAYWIGRRLKTPVQNRLFSGDKRRHLDRAERGLRDRGGTLIFVGRFIPGGRSAITFGAGVLEYRYRRFLFFDVIAGILWACYAALIGYIGGEAFEESPVKGILLALAIAFAFTGLVEGIRWWRRRQVRQAGVVEPVAGDDPS